jgi:hypothetical protein
MARRGEEMSDDFGTVNVRRGERAREIERLREHYREHREALVDLAGEAPTEYLSGEYQRLIHDIDSALAKIDEIEGRRPATPELQEPGARTLLTPPPPLAADAGEGAGAQLGSRLVLIVVAGVIVLAIIGYLIYRASGDRGQATTTTTATIAETSAPSTIAPTSPAPVPSVVGLAVSPVVIDYGTIRKGTRATRQVELANNTSALVSYKVARSQCHCLIYEYKEKIPPKQKETITVTIDGARAKAGTLQETIDVTSKTDPSVTTSFQVTATIK